MITKIYHPLLALIASATNSELAKYVEYLKEENKILKEKIGEVTEGTKTLSEAVDKLTDQDDVFFSRRFVLPRRQGRLASSNGLLLSLGDFWGLLRTLED